MIDVMPKPPHVRSDLIATNLRPQGQVSNVRVLEMKEAAN